MTRVFACFVSAAVFNGFQGAFSPWKESIPKQPPPKSSKRYCQPRHGTNILTWEEVLQWCHVATVILTLPNSMALSIFVGRTFKLRRLVTNFVRILRATQLRGFSRQPFALRHFVTMSDHERVVACWGPSRHRVTGWKAAQQHWHPGCMPR